MSLCDAYPGSKRAVKITVAFERGSSMSLRRKREEKGGEEGGERKRGWSWRGGHMERASNDN
jgi:hypothetical protein